MKALAVAFLLLLAIFTGGCSLFATPLMFSAGINAGAILIWLSGFVVAGFCIFALTKTMPRLEPPQTAPPKPSQDATNPDDRLP